MREQHEDCRPARHQRLAPAAPELERRKPGVTGHDSAGEQDPQLQIAGETRQMRDNNPGHWTGSDIHGQRRTAVEYAGAAPGNGKAQEQQSIGEIDGNRLGHIPVEAKQHD
jgi:hypothetical protein